MSSELSTSIEMASEEGEPENSQRRLRENGSGLISRNGSTYRPTGQDGILIYPKDLLINSSSPTPNLTFVTLPHPRYGHNVEFIQVNSHHLYEFQIVQPRKGQYGSWFIDQRVSSNSSFYLLSKYDLRFLLLPFFIFTSARYSPLSQIISSTLPTSSKTAATTTASSGPTATTDEPQANEMRKIQLKYQSEWKLDEICDVNDKLGADMLLYRLNYDKLLHWLRGKVTKLTQVIYQKRKQKEFKESKSLFDSSFQSKSKSDERRDDDDVEGTSSDEDLKTALTIILDYLPDSVTLQLLQSYDMSIESLTTSTQNSNKRKADWEAALEVLEILFLLSLFLLLID